MSLILDALKKSEAERQRGQAPHILSPLPAAPSHVHAGKASKLPWLILMAALFAMMVAAYFYAQSRVAVTPAITHLPAENKPAQTAAIASDETSIPVVEAPKPVVIEKPPVPQTETTAPVTTAPAIMPPTIAPAPVVDQTEAAPALANLSDMPAEQRQQLPPLKLSMHVFSMDAGKRFAIIDGQRVNEGGLVGSVVIEQIRQDGVVLSVQGQSYLLPRP